MTENPDEPMEVREAISTRDFGALERAKPKWLKDKGKPDWIDAEKWIAFYSDEDREEALEAERLALESWLAEREGRVQWPKESLEETVKIFYTGITSSGQAAEHPISAPDYGRGVAGDWQEFQGNSNAAQYLNLNRILGAGYPAVHFNLCGELAVSAIMGLELADGLGLFAQVAPTDKSQEVLKKGTTSFGSQLAGMINLASEGKLKASYRTANFAPPLKINEPTQMLEMLNTGRKLVTLVNIAKGSGLLSPVSPNSKVNIAHWVGVVDVMRLRQGNYAVRIYNSYHNQEEFYTWSAFRAAWEQTDGNSSRYGVVLAEPV